MAMKHELNTELCDLGKQYQGGQISLEKYRLERRAVIDKMASKKPVPAKKKASILVLLPIVIGGLFLAAYWLL
ncbi:MAG: hypothetical protein H7A01_15380 [Hahellaceae bacterium]|nr:hypothetical protein [Hahellaceae bacterium]MCP5210444.1 hypothetical protein [Hahellaceae bacterium]